MEFTLIFTLHLPGRGISCFLHLHLSSLLAIGSAMKKGLAALFLIGTVASCVTREICDENNQSEMVAWFKTEADGAVSDTIFTTVSVYGTRSGEDFSIIYDSVSASRIVLPLDPNGVSTTFVIDFGSQADTLSIRHDTEYYLISYTCGFAALFTLEMIEHSGNVILGSEVINPVVDAELEQNEEHIWLYF